MVYSKKLTGLFFGLILSGVVTMPYAVAYDCDSGYLTTTEKDTCKIKEETMIIKDKIDMKTSELAQSIINYLGQIEQKRYNLMVLWHTDPAPGTNNAMTAGKNIKEVAEGHGESVITKVGSTLIKGLGVAGEPQKNPESKLYDSLTQKNITTDGNASKILNFASLYQKLSIPTEDTNVDLLVELIADPYPTPFSIPTNPIDVEGKAAMANAAVEKAVVSVALNTFKDMIEKRNPKAGQSMLELMEKESSWRLQNTEWFKNISLVSQEAVVREIAQMMAFNMWMNYQQYRQNEQIAAMMAASIASQARLNSAMISISKILGEVKGQVKAAKADQEVKKLKVEINE